MVHNLSLAHDPETTRAVRGAYVSEWALFAPGTAALFVAAGLFLIQIGAGQPRWAFAAAAAIGLAIGLVRGMMIGVRHDHYRPVVMISRDAKLVFLAVGIGVGVCARSRSSAPTRAQAWRESACGRRSAPWSVPWRCWPAR